MEDFDKHEEKDDISIDILHGVINDGSFVEMPIVGIGNYSASLLKKTSNDKNRTEEVRGYTMKELLESITYVDLVHIDIQGYEELLLRDQIDMFVEKVRYIAVGTHSREIESYLIGFLSQNDFRIMRETPCSFSYKKKHDYMVDATYMDGFQIWVNCRLVPNDPF